MICWHWRGTVFTVDFSFFAVAALVAVRGGALYFLLLFLACLLHDASEAYLSDITRPVKGCLPEYRRIEQVLQEMIYEKYLIAPPTEREREIVKRMDDTCLYYEFEHFTGEKLFDVAPQATVLPEYRECPMREVEKKFLALFEKLMAQTVQEDGERTDQ